MESDPQYPLRTYWAKRLKKRLVQPRLPGSELHGSLRDCYKIKLRQQGYRLVYSVDDGAVVVLVLALDKRENMAAYQSALERLLSRS